MLRLGALLLTTLLLAAGCNSLDDDTRYTPQWQASYFVVSNGNSPGVLPDTRIVRIGPEGIEANWLPSMAQLPQHLASNDAFLWYPTASGHLQRYDLLQQQARAAFALPAAVRACAAGQRYMLLADATQSRLYFLQQVMGLSGTVALNLDFIADGILYNAGKYVVYGNNASGARMLLIDEESLAVQQSWTLTSQQIYAASYTSIFRVQLLMQATAGGARSVYTLDPGAASLDAGTSTDRLRIQSSPFSKAAFDRNYLQTISLGTNQRLNLPQINDLVQYFDTDFRGSYLYYQKGDSLVRYDLQAGRRLNAWLLPYSGAVVLAAHHHYRQQ